jgi:hypothetical protein
MVCSHLFKADPILHSTMPGLTNLLFQEKGRSPLFEKFNSLLGFSEVD